MIGNPAPYGIKAIRQIRGKKKPTPNVSKKMKDTYEYFLKKVDPLLGPCITYLLCEQPSDIPNAMIDYFINLSNKEQIPETTEEVTQKKRQRPKKEMKVFLASSIGPVVAKLTNRIALSQPRDVAQFIIHELKSMLEEEAMAPEQPKPEIPIPTTTEKTTQSISKSVARESIAQVMQTVAMPKVVVDLNTPPPQKRSIQLAVMGLSGGGKTTILNFLEGKFDARVRPTVGFRPVSMSLSEEVDVKFFDLGGGKKIREIWRDYYHDAHAVVYVIDGAAPEEELEDCLQVFFNTMKNPLIIGKPVLVLINKQDLNEARSSEEWKKLLVLRQEDFGMIEGFDIEKNVMFADCSSNPPNTEEEFQNFAPDPRIEAALEKLFESVQKDYTTLQDRVIEDSKVKAATDAKKRVARERKVLKNKIASAFHTIVDPEKFDTSLITPDPDNVFTMEEGLTFLAAEIGEDPEDLLPIARRICAGVGYQRLALQIVGALKAPISKKKVPMEWEEIQTLVFEVREELGLPEIPL